MDVGTVRAHAEAFARAVAADNTDLIQGYLSEELKENIAIARLLGGLPRPIRSAEVLTITTPVDGQYISVTRFTGFRGGKLLRAIWIEEQQQPVIRAAWIVNGKS